MAIRAADDPPEELIVVDQPSAAVPAAARNAGAERAAQPVLVFVDSDVIVHRDAFTRIRAAFDRDPDLTALFGSYDDAPEAPGAVSGFRNLLHHHVHQSAAGRVGTFWTGLGAIRRAAFGAAGGFDETLPWMEDVDLGIRLSREGARIVLDPTIQGTHLKSWTLPQMVWTDLARRGVPWVGIVLRSGGGDQLNLGWRHRLSAAACLIGLAALARRRAGVALAALATLVALNLSFYGLLLRRRGAAEAASGVFLHALHHLTAASAVPVGLAAHLRGSRAGSPAMERRPSVTR
jgi:hypothetical protein